MKGALGKKELLAVVPLSWSTIDRMERAGEFPKRWYITDKRCALKPCSCDIFQVGLTFSLNPTLSEN
ncbi:helix-turn-helix transcriptional regulator [Escherichia coli]|uniref:helix-turn-helix transcriptional regulator n=1 Tax=Escherichia coli TaxID=562 RepID=UPI000B203033